MPQILQQNLIANVVQLLKITRDGIIRLRLIRTLLNCCVVPQGLSKMTEGDKGCGFLWNLLVKFSSHLDETHKTKKEKKSRRQSKSKQSAKQANSQFISCTILNN